MPAAIENFPARHFFDLHSCVLFLSCPDVSCPGHDSSVQSTSGMHILRRLWLPATLLLYALLAASTLVGQHGLLHLQEIRQEQQALEAEAFTLARENVDLQDRITRLKTDDEFLEKVAREELGFVGKGEIVYRFRDSLDASGR